MSLVTITGHVNEMHSPELDTSINDSPRAQGIPRKRSTGPKEREREESEERQNQQSRTRKTTRQRHTQASRRPGCNPGKKKQKGATEARTEKDAHGTSSETNTGTPTPQREGTIIHRPATSTRAPTVERQGRREQRREGRVQINPRKQHYRKDCRGTEEAHN